MKIYSVLYLAFKNVKNSGLKFVQLTFRGTSLIETKICHIIVGYESVSKGLKVVPKGLWGINIFHLNSLSDSVTFG